MPINNTYTASTGQQNTKDTGINPWKVKAVGPFSYKTEL